VIFPLDFDFSTMGIDVKNDCYPIAASDAFKLTATFTCQLHNDYKNWIEFIGNT
jgi:hypothetical protein